MWHYLTKKIDSLLNIFIHKILVCIAYKKYDSLKFYIIAWNILTFDSFGTRNSFRLVKLIIGYEKSLLERSKLEKIFNLHCESKNIRLILGLQKISTALGFFQIGSKFNTQYCELLIRAGIDSESIYKISRAIKALISIGRLGEARVLLKSIEKIDPDFTTYCDFIKSANIFLDLCESKDISEGSHKNSFDVFIKNEKILLLGPAQNKLKIFSKKYTNHVICRRVGIGADEFKYSYKGNIKRKIAYSDNNYLQNKLDIKKWMEKEEIAFLVNNQNTNLDEIDVRSARTFNELYVSGSANKMQIAIYDLLLGCPKSIYCDGITFFATSVSYSIENLDINHDGNKIMQNGSDGNRFYTSVALAEHNVFVNRQMAINLCGNSKVKTSKVMSDILQLSEEQYSKNLDDLYGLHQI
jgi:hypothetical protein